MTLENLPARPPIHSLRLAASDKLKKGRESNARPLRGVDGASMPRVDQGVEMARSADSNPVYAPLHHHVVNATSWGLPMGVCAP